eukprot:4441292-Prymnesium_polylepis.1
MSARSEGKRSIAESKSDFSRHISSQKLMACTLTELSRSSNRDCSPKKSVSTRTSSFAPLRIMSQAPWVMKQRA